jgi:TP901 family phage tail tape measure protein
MGLKIVLDTKDASKNADEFAKAIARISTATGLAGKSADDLMRLTAKMSRRFGRIGSSADKAAASVTRMGVGMDTASKSAGKFGESASRASATSGKLARQVKKLAGAFLGFRAVSASVRTLADLEQGIVTLGTVTGSTAAELAELQKVSVQVAQATRFTPKETTQALLELSRAGQDAATASKSLIDVANLAAAGVLELGAAAGLTAATMAQFKKQNLSATEIAATFVAVADRTKSTVTSLGSAMSQAGQASAEFGISMETAVIAVGVLQTAGIQASRSGRAIKTILASLATAGERGRGRSALEKLGLEMEDLEVKGGDLVGLFKRIRDASDNLADGDRVSVLTALVGKDFFGVLSAAMAGVEDMTDLAGKLGGKVEELADKAKDQNDTLAGSMRGVISAFQEATLVTGDGGATGALKGFFNTISGSVRLLAGVEGGLAGASTASMALAGAIKGIGAIVAFRTLAAGVSFFTVKMALAEGQTIALTRAQMLLGRATPWGLIATGIGVAVALLSTYSSKQAAVAKRQKDIFEFSKNFREDTVGEFGKEKILKTSRNIDIKDKEKLEGARTSQTNLELLKAKLDDQRRINAKYLKEEAELQGSSNEKFTKITIEQFKDIQYLVDEKTRQGISEGMEQTKRVEKNLQDRADLQKKFAEESYRPSLAVATNPLDIKSSIALAQLKIKLKSDLKSNSDESLSIGPRTLINKAFEEEAFRSARESIEAEISLLEDRETARKKAEGKKVGGLSETDIKIEDFKSNALIADSYKAINQAIEEGLPSSQKFIEITKEKIKQEMLLISLRSDGDEQGGTGANDIKVAAQTKLNGLMVERKVLLLEIAKTEKDGREGAKAAEKILKDVAALQERDAKAAMKIAKDKAKREKALEDHLKEVIRLRKLDSLSSFDREIEEARFSAENDLLKLGANPLAASAGGNQAGSDVRLFQEAQMRGEQLEKELDESARLYQESKQSLEATGAMFGNSLSQALFSIADGAKSAKEAFADMAKSMIQQLIQMQMVKGFSALLGSFAGTPETSSGIALRTQFSPPVGTGSVLANQQGGIIPAQQGRIINSPSNISRGGRNYSVSEGGGSTPEGVFPLTKNSRGQLAIEAVGGGGGVMNFSFPGIRNSADAKATKRTIGQSVGAIIAASEAKKNRMGMRPKK